MGFPAKVEVVLKEAKGESLACSVILGSSDCDAARTLMQTGVADSGGCWHLVDLAGWEARLGVVVLARGDCFRLPCCLQDQHRPGRSLRSLSPMPDAIVRNGRKKSHPQWLEEY